MPTKLREAVGAAVRAARLDRGWTQTELGAAARVSRSLVSAIEVGSCAWSIESLEHVAEALRADLVVELRPPLVVGREEQHDAAHSLCVASVRRWLQRRGWTCVVEVPIVDGRIRGWIDLLAFDPVSGRLLVVEVKTELRDLGGLQRQIGWYGRDAPKAAASLGWRHREVVVLVVFLATQENDQRFGRQWDAISASFPVRGRALGDALEGGPFRSWGLTMIDPRRRGARRWIGLRRDGRRAAPPYASYVDFMKVVASGSRARRVRI